MDTFAAFIMGEANRGRPLRVFDWNKAATLIKERSATQASAGLTEDWDWTGGSILKDGKPDMEDYTYLASTWATPVLIIDGDYIECFLMENDVPGWNAETKWPESALAILG